MKSNTLLRALLQEYRAHRMAQFTVWVLAYGAALLSVDRLSAGAPLALWVLFGFAAITCAVYYLGRLVGRIRPWRLRRRLIVAYVFIAIVPILRRMPPRAKGSRSPNGAVTLASGRSEHPGPAWNRRTTATLV